MPQSPDAPDSASTTPGFPGIGGDGAGVLRVLVVARWYPSHDQPNRGQFVADHVAALRAAGLDVVVASFEPIAVRGETTSRSSRAAEARALWRKVLRAPDALNHPRSWGAGVPVARLPVVLDAGQRTETDLVEAHAAALDTFAEGLAERWTFSLIHAHTGLPDGAAAAGVAERLGLPLVITEHDSTITARLAVAEARDLYGELFGPRRTVLAVSASLARELAEALAVPAGRIGVLPNPVEVERFAGSSQSSGEMAPAERDADQLLYVGNRKASKGMETLLRAFALVHATRPSLRLRLIGRAQDEAEERRWRDLAGELGVAEAVRFEPPAGRDQVAAAMARAGTFVHPSPRETFGVVAAEALAAGLPVAAAPSSGVAEILGETGAYGQLAASPAPADLATAIRQVLDRRSTFEQAALRRRAEAYSPQAVAARAIEVYRSIGAIPVAAGELGSPSSEPDALSAAQGLPLVVGLNRPEVVREIEALPVSLVSRLRIVTTRPGSGGPAAQPATLPQGPSWIEIDPDSSYLQQLDALGPRLPRGANLFRRAVAFLRDPGRARRRRRLYEQRERLRAADLERGLESAWAAEAETGGGWVLAHEAGDVIEVTTLIERGARLAPGSLRWLADRWDQANPPSTDVPVPAAAAPAVG